MAITIIGQKVYSPPSTSATVNAVLSTATARGRAPTAVTGTAPSASLKMNGDYSTGNFSQWHVVQNVFYNQLAVNYPPNTYYPLKIVTDPVKGYVARFECRPGDWPGFASPTSERTEIYSDTGGALLNDTTWCVFSVKFDPSFIINHRPLCYFAVTHQFYSWPGAIHPTIAFSYREVANKWSMWIQRQGSATPAYDPNPWTVDILPGTWHDMKMQVKWSDLDNVGFVKLWRNGVPQLFSNGTTTLPGRTMNTGDTYWNHHQGIYRGQMNTSVLATDIVYHHGYKIGYTEASVS